MEKKCILAGILSPKSKNSNNGIFPITQIQVNSWNVTHLSSDTDKPNNSSYLTTFVNLHSYFLIFPFRVVYSFEHENFVISTSKPRQVTLFYEML